MDLGLNQLVNNSVPFIILHNIQMLWVLIRQKISYILIVDLEEAVLEFYNIISYCLYLLLSFEQIFKDEMRYSFLLLLLWTPKHSVRFPRARDPISKYCKIKPLE